MFKVLISLAELLMELLELDSILFESREELCGLFLCW